MARFTSLLVALSLTTISVSSTALAWDPNAGAEPAARPAARYMPRLPVSVVPQRYYSSGIAATAAPTVNATATAVNAPVYAPAPAPIAPAYAPSAPTYAPPAYVQNAAHAYAPAPVVTPAYQPAQSPASNVAFVPANYSAPRSTYDANRFSVGIEGFYDHYEEPVTFPSLNSNAYYGSIDLGWEHYFSPTLFTNVEQRVSRGWERYKSSQGHIDDVPQWEFETRFTGGYDAPLGHGRHFKTYIGLGSHYYIDDAKGGVTTGGTTAASAYERRIFQVYAPIGATYIFPAYGLTFAPNFEIDPLLYGSVNSRLQNIAGFQEFTNRQKGGIGWRAEFMMGKDYANGNGWEFGPFARYWLAQDPEVDRNASGSAIEPKNTRIQLGAKLKVKF